MKAIVIEITSARLNALPEIPECFEPEYICRLQDGRIVKSFPYPPDLTAQIGDIVDVGTETKSGTFWYNE